MVLVKTSSDDFKKTLTTVAKNAQLVQQLNNGLTLQGSGTWSVRSQGGS